MLQGPGRRKRKHKAVKKINTREQLAQCMQLFQLEDIHMFWVGVPCFSANHSVCLKGGTEAVPPS